MESSDRNVEYMRLQEAKRDGEIGSRWRNVLSRVVRQPTAVSSLQTHVAEDPVPVQYVGPGRSRPALALPSEVYGRFKPQDVPESSELQSGLFDEYEGVPLLSRSPSLKPRKPPKGRVHRCCSFLRRSTVTRTYFCLIVLAMVVSLLTWGIDMVFDGCSRAFDELYKADMPRWCQFVTTTVLRLCLVELAVWITTAAPLCAGSGIPAVKALLSGSIQLDHAFTLRTLVVKTIGISLALGSLLPVGKEGPCIHMAAAVAMQLRRIKWFGRLGKHRFMAAAAAVGVASCFVAPIGGVLFSIEVTTTLLLVANYWTAFFAAVAGAAFVHIFHRLKPTSLLFLRTDFEQFPYNEWELFSFCILGLACGLLGALYVHLHARFVSLRRRYQKRLIGTNPFAIAAVVALLTSVLVFPADFLRRRPQLAVSDLFTAKTLHNATFTHDSDWTIGGGVHLNLVFFFAFQFLVSIASVSLALPCGVFTPVFAAGAAMGRLSGEIMGIWFSNIDSAYAVVGAAALTSAVTGTVSPAVIVLEMTEQMHLALPVLVAVSVARWTASGLADTIYNSLLQLKGVQLLPLQPGPHIAKSHKLFAKHVMRPLGPQCPFVPVRPTKEEVDTALEALQSSAPALPPPLPRCPVVDNRDARFLLGEVDRAVLLRYRDCLEQDTEGTQPILSAQFCPGINQSPFQVTTASPLGTLYFLFHVLRPRCAFVTHNGALVGALLPADLLALEMPRRHTVQPSV